MDYLIIIVVTFLVRIISATVGGGGMVLLPMLIFLGLNPAEAIATNRLSAFSINIAIIKYHQKKLVKWRIASYLIIPTLIGGLLGGIMATHIDQELFKKLLGLVILISIPMLFYKKDIGIKEFKVTKLRIFLGMILMFFASFLGGMFASTGIWMSYALLIFGLTMLQASGTKKILGTMTALSSFSYFLFMGIVHWPYAITMFITSGFGSWIGTCIGIKLGNEWIKRLFAVIVVISAIKLIFM